MPIARTAWMSALAFCLLVGEAAGGREGALLGGPAGFPGVFNARQAGGLLTTDGRRVKALALIRSGHLGSMGEEGCAAFKALGIKTVIDLRSQDEIARAPDAACVSGTAAYHRLELPRILPPSERSYRDTLLAAEPKLAALFRRLGKPKATPAVIHCVIGRDRAGIALAVVLLALGVPAPAVVDDFARNQEAEVEASWLKAVTGRIEEEGGIGAYLDARGVDRKDIQALRAQALEPLK